VALLLLCQLGLRHRAGAGRARPPAWVVALDAAPLLIGAALFAGLTARPLFGAIVVAVLAAGLALADGVKRRVLREPVVFADRAELVELVRHPEFYVPFAGTATVAAGAVAAIALAGGVAWLVPPVWRWSPWPPLAAVAVAAAGLALPGWPPLTRWLRARYAALAPSRDPDVDAARWGMLACFAIHATLARAERPARRAAPAVLRQPRGTRRGPVLMVQLESFCDPRGRHPAVPADLLPGLDACRDAAAAWGRLDVPCWGANTVRTEFAALTGLGADRVGLDRFNPYERFARSPVDSVAWRMRAAGRRAICLHPFDKRFYGRHRAMPALGFERFIGPEAFAGAARAGGHVSDADLATKAAEILAECGPDLFLFVISVGNHGPWLADRGAEDAWPAPPGLADVADAAALRRFLGGLRRTDQVFPILTRALRDADAPGLLLAYGDHQPSLPGLFAAGDPATDYVLWDAEPGGPVATRPRRRSAEALPGLLLDRLDPDRSRPMAAREVAA
jgi:hypothetical protein